ncbi:MAG: metal ABC transporter ATP-binding protein [Andreesenia angusta]|nr:metal ABC transporter ATP-binding protein [Andreesenia angusta]
MNCIEVKNLKFGYTNERIINNLNLIIEEGEFSIIQGDNGSGKSTLLKLILGDLTRESGSIKIMGKDIKDYKSYKDIGYVPQVNATNKISFPVTCLELVTLGLYEDFGFIKIPKKRHKKRAKMAIERMGMGEYINRPFNELSGGQQQRIMISRAMVNDPKIIVLDEPTVGIDQKSKEDFFEFLVKLNREKRITIVLVTHEIEFVSRYVGKIYRIVNGEIENVTI